MTTQPIYKDKQNALSVLVRAWDRRLRLQQMIRWFAWSLAPGLALGILLAVISRLQPFLLREQVLNLTLVAIGTGVAALFVVVLFYPRSIQKAAQQFDVMFRMNERVSTALELIGGKIRSNEEFTSRQLDDAISRAQTVRPRDYLPLYVRWQDWAVVAVLALVLGTLFFLPNPMEDAVIEAAETNEAIEEAADDLREVVEDVAADPSLSEEERENLLQELDNSIETLERPDITEEEAFATLSDVESELQEQANALSEQLEQQRQAMADAQSALAEGLPSEMDDADASEAGSGETTDMSETLEQFQEAAESAEGAESQSMAEALERAAEALENTNPQASQSLQDASEALEQGNNSQSQQSLQDAQDAVEQGQQQQSQQQQSQQNLQEGANQAQQGQQNLQQGQQQQGQQQQGQQGQQQGQQGQQQQGQQQQGQQGQQPGQQGEQQGQQGQQSGQQGQQGQQPGQQGQQPGSGAQAGQQPGAQAPAQGAPSNSGQNAGGAGDGEGGQNEGGFDGGDGQMRTDNNPDGEGVDEFDPIYAPQRLGGEGDTGFMLEPGDENQPLFEGDFSENPTGNASVPYNEVYQDYSSDAQQALESDYIPLGMKDVVREYFTSIEPGN